ncbi:chemotaxis protein CheB, partial [Acinetobacter baumannii]
GAVDCYSKCDRSGGLPLDDNGKLASLVRQASRTRVGPRAVAPASLRRVAQVSTGAGPQLIAIGSSTGGVEALQVLLAEFPEDCPPTVIVQHINA